MKLFILLLLTANIISAGGGVRNGTGAAPQLLIPVGARGVAMSSSSVAGSAGLESIYYNPANLALESGTSVMISHMTHIADIGVSYFGLSTNVEGFGALAFTLKSLSIDDIDVTTVENPDGNGQTFKPSFMTFGLTYSRLLSDRITVGLTINYITETLGLVNASGLGFNAGVTYQNLANINGFNIAFVLKNLGAQMQFDGSGMYTRSDELDLERGQTYLKREAMAFDLPSTLEVGMSYKYSINASNSLLLNGTYQNTNYYADEYKLGMEYSLNDMFFVRGGYMFTPEFGEGQDDYNSFGLTAGLGIKYNLGGTTMKVDYAFREVKYFDANHVFTLQFGL